MAEERPTDETAETEPAAETTEPAAAEQGDAEPETEPEADGA